MRSLWLLLCNLVGLLNKLWQSPADKRAAHIMRLEREIMELENELFNLQDRRTRHHDHGYPVPAELQGAIHDNIRATARKRRELRALEGE